MQERTLENLILDGEDYIFAGDLTIEGDVILKNASLIVSGELCFPNNFTTISITGGNILAETLSSYATITIRDGDICVSYLDTSDIDSDSNIEVSKDSNVSDISCLNYEVSGDSNSHTINAIQDVFILGYSDSDSITARDVLIGCDCNLHSMPLTAKSFECQGEIINCYSMSIG